MVYLYNCVKITRCYNLLHFPPPQPRCTACRILVPWPETESRPWQWKHQVLTTGPPGNSLPRSIFEMSTVGACSSDSFILMALYLLFHSMTMSPFTCPVYCWWSFGLFPLHSYYVRCCSEYSCTSIFMLLQELLNKTWSLRPAAPISTVNLLNMQILRPQTYCITIYLLVRSWGLP